jgi:hypothetical protein
MEFGCWKWMRVEMRLTEGRGAQLSQVRPPSIKHQPMGTNKRTAQCRWMRPLVPIGLGLRK